MEIVGGVASVITVVTLALQSTKVIYEAVSSINHGSDGINRLVKATSNLEKVLEFLHRLASHAKATSNVAEGKLLEELAPLIDQCAQTLREILPKLGQLQKNSNDRRWQKARKIAKVYLDTKSVADIWNTVNHYVNLLGSCLGNASVDVGLHNAQELRKLRGEISSASQDHKYGFIHVEEILRDQRTLAQAEFDALQVDIRRNSLDARAAATTQMQGVAELKEWQQQFEKAATEQYRKTTDLGMNLQAVRATVTDESDQVKTEIRKGTYDAKTSLSAHAEESALRNEEVMQELHSISDRLEGVSSMTSEQLTTVQTLVSMLEGIQLGERIRYQDTHNDTTSKAYPTADGKSDDFDMANDPDYEAIVARINDFANRIATHTYSRDAQLIIEDIGRLLGLVMQQSAAKIPDRDDLPRKRKILCDYHYAELETEVQSMELLSRAKRALTSTQRVQLSNSDLKRTDESDKSGSWLISHTKKALTRKQTVPIANLQDSTRSWVLRHARLDAVVRTMLLQETEDQSKENAETLAAKLIITPTAAQLSKFKIIIDIASREYQNHAIYFTPTLTFHATIPDDSEVFRIVKSGSVQKLKKLLSTGAASLGDCDSMGRSLLNFALHYHRVKMTSFLIQSGADIDTLERSISIPGYQVKPLVMCEFLDNEDADEDAQRVDRCYKLLLDAGSDISSILIPPPCDGGTIESALSVGLSAGSLVKVKALVDLGEPFISLEATVTNDRQGRTPLLLLADDHAEQWGGSYQIPGKIALLLSRGVKVNARDSSGGSCLHLVSRHIHWESRCPCGDEIRWWRHLSMTKDILIMMISAGADVCAIDEDGESVSDVALCSGLEMLWTDALKYCGIDIKDVLARSNFNPAYSTAVDSRYSGPSELVTSKISLTEYLERRKALDAFYDEIDQERKRRPGQGSSDEDDSDDEDLKSRDSPSEDDDNGDEDWSDEDASGDSEVDEQESDDEDHDAPIQYESSGKAKLD